MAGLVESLERLLEPIARAVRRGDAVQMKALSASIRSAWAMAAQQDSNVEATLLARGMTKALEGVLSFACARSGSDARATLVKSRKYALPVLHALGERARVALHEGLVTKENLWEDDRASLSVSDLEHKTGVLAQNLKGLIDAMEDCDLLRTERRGQKKNVFLTEDGLAVLDSVTPGWQVIPVPKEQPFDDAAIASALRAALTSYLGNLVEDHATPDLFRALAVMGPHHDGPRYEWAQNPLPKECGLPNVVSCKYPGAPTVTVNQRLSPAKKKPTRQLMMRDNRATLQAKTDRGAIESRTDTLLNR